MGLDIYLFQVIKKGDDNSDIEVFNGDKHKTEITLSYDESNKSYIEGFTRFSDFTYEVDSTYLDISGYTDKHNMKDYRIIGQSFGEEATITFAKYNGKEIDYDDQKEIKQKDFDVIIQKEKQLDVVEVGYQRKCMKV
jgi:hypothetical protein